MKDNKKEKIIEFVANKNEWITSYELSAYVGVSTRQIRKYITSINEEYNDALIQSSRQGYKIDIEKYQDYKFRFTDEMSPKSRQQYIVRKLISNMRSYSIYDLADELYVSDSTVNQDLKEIKIVIDKYGLSLTRNHNIVSIEGTESKMRKLMNDLISKEMCGDFVFMSNAFSSMEQHFVKIRDFYKKAIASRNISTNDFALNNTAIHFIIILDRLKNGYYLDDIVDLSNYENSAQFQVALEIKDYFKENYNVIFNSAELYNILLIIDNHINHTEIVNYENLNSENISKYVEKKYIDITRKLIKEVEKNYYLQPFHEEFVAKLTLHIKNLFFRVRNDYYAKNPLTEKIKFSYPLIYDISVFIAQKLKEEHQIILNEDEIAFISFHIGAYFENNSLHPKHINCAFIYSGYYNYHLGIMDKILKKFDDKIVIRYETNITDFKASYLNGIDLIISTVERAYTEPYICISPFMKENDWINLGNMIDEIFIKKKKKVLSSYILNFFNRNIFYKDPQFVDRYDCIQCMSNELLKMNYVDNNFYEDVCAREKLSSTAFSNVALPHALATVSTKESFISVALCNTPLEWGNRKVYIVALIGINDASRKVFSEFFDELIDIFNEYSNVQKLLESESFESFIEILKCLLE